jgi:hypothetical protein
MDFLKRINVREYYGEKYTVIVQKARQLLKTCPPDNFLEKWSRLKEEEFRSTLSDNDAVVTMLIAITLVANKPIPLYYCDDWQLLSENMNLQI